MKSIMLLLLSLCLGLTAAPTQDKGWRGIIPLHSTRADVERLLGKPDTQSEIYDLEDARVSLIYQRYTCTENKGEGYNVPRDTVIRINVSLKNKDRSLSDFPVDLTQYKKTEGGHVRGYAYYSNEEQGITYETYFDKVITLTYGATTADAHLRCSDTLKPPALFSANELTPAGKNLLDSFVLRLKREPEACGLVNLNQEYKKPEEAESMRRSVADYLRRAHGSMYARLSIGLNIQKDDLEFLILRKDGKRPRQCCKNFPTTQDIEAADSPAQLIAAKIFFVTLPARALRATSLLVRV